MSDPRLIPVAEHPRAAEAIRRAKAYAGLSGFGLVALLGFSHGAPLEAALGRALVGGVVAYLLIWAAALAVWKRLLVAEAVAVARRAGGRTRPPAAE
jgi:hypothetical protein